MNPFAAVAELAESMAWPRVQLGDVVIEGDGWRAALSGVPRLMPVDALLLLLELDGISVANDDGLPAWLVPELCVTSAARGRLRAWLAAGAPEPDAEALLRGIRFVGEAGLRVIVIDALLKTPPPVRWSAVSESWLFLGIGHSYAGLMARIAPISGPLTLVQVSGASHDPRAVRDLAWHETAHAYLMAIPEQPVAAEALENERDWLLLSAARRPELMEEIVTEESRDERQADALAAVWGSRLTCSGERAVSNTRSRAAALLRTFGERVP